MKRGILFIALTLAVCLAQAPAADRKAASTATAKQAQGYAGSQSCRECHERFYQLWSTSKHGLAMQPHAAEFARTQLTAQQ